METPAVWFITLKELIIHSYNIKNGKIKRLHKLGQCLLCNPKDRPWFISAIIYQRVIILTLFQYCQRANETEIRHFYLLLWVRTLNYSLQKICFDCFVALLLQQKIIRACCSPVSHSMSQLVKNKIIVQQAALRKATLFNSSLFCFCYACLTISQKEMAIKTISCIFFPQNYPVVKCAVVRFVHLRD